MRVRVGLVSDTHIPQRWPRVPEVLASVFAGVDLVLHAGDVGELWVLDELSGIAPVVAVHGNDDSADSQRELPYQQVVTVGGKRILLWHSHYPDRQEELKARREDRWEPSLARLAQRGRRAAAQVVVYGHTHIPLARVYDGVLLVNPGAIASGNIFTRQTRQTAALLTLDGDGPPRVRHVDLAAPDQVCEAPVDWSAGFRAALVRYQASMITPELQRAFDGVTMDVFRNPQAVIDAILPLSHACWAGQSAFITAEDLRRAVVGLEDGDRAVVLGLIGIEV